MGSDQKVLVIGCGLTGSVIARHLAQQGKNVVIWERRNHIGGNMFDCIDDNGILVHKYGPHVFHTNQDSLAEYMRQYGQWEDFPITCKVEMMGKTTPSPFNFQTIDDFYEPEEAETLKNALLSAYPGRDKVTIVELLESREPIIRGYAQFLFEHDYSLYTAKQWGVSPAEIDPSVLKRVPVLLSYKDGYFDDKWQMVPRDGYTRWFEELLDHENIQVHLNVEALDRMEIRENRVWVDGKPFDGTVIYTGPLDALFGQVYGELPYRSLEFRWKTEPVWRYQAAPLVAYPEAPDFTRVTEYSHFPQKERRHVTSLAYEYPLVFQPGGSAEPYYPILTEKSQEDHRKYRELADRVEGLICCGRLADFKYYNMDQALENALGICERLM